jgi:holo-[acyl-carrier protein] synthase
MGQAIERGKERLLDRLFTPREQADAAGTASAERFAARFAAKEAALKALGTGWSGGISWRDLEVVREVSGRTRLAISGRAAEKARDLGVVSAHLSVTHDGGVAAAVVVLEGAA